MRQVFGVAWYSPAAWPRLKEVAPDSDRLEASHAEWLEVALAACAKFASAGVEVVRIDVDPAELLEWCREQGRPADARARAHFVAEKLRQRDAAVKSGDAGD